jgi:hypothetical protein
MCGTFYLFGSRHASSITATLERLPAISPMLDQNSQERVRFQKGLVGHRVRPCPVTLWPLHTTRKEGVVYRAYSFVLPSCRASFHFASALRL